MPKKVEAYEVERPFRVINLDHAPPAHRKYLRDLYARVLPEDYKVERRTPGLGVYYYGPKDPIEAKFEVFKVLGETAWPRKKGGAK